LRINQIARRLGASRGRGYRAKVQGAADAVSGPGHGMTPSVLDEFGQPVSG
jgi:hypothetical protein